MVLYLGELAIRIPGAGCSTSLLLLCWELGMRVEWSTRTLVLVQETHRKRVQSMFSVLRMSVWEYDNNGSFSCLE